MNIKYVRKNDGTTEKFKPQKLENSINLALLHVGIHDRTLAPRLAHETIDYLLDKGKMEVADSSEIREAVLYVLGRDGFTNVAEAYEMTSLHLKSPGVKRVEKRGGEKQTLHPHKIFISVRRACMDCGLQGPELAEEVTRDVVNELGKTHKGKAITSQTIKNLTARKLEQKGFRAVAKTYMKHRYV